MKRVYKPRGKTQADRDWINNLVPEFKKKDDGMGGISADHVMQGTKKDSVLAWGKVKVKQTALSDDMVCITGSIFTVGEAKQYLENESDFKTNFSPSTGLHLNR